MRASQKEKGDKAERNMRMVNATSALWSDAGMHIPEWRRSGDPSMLDFPPQVPRPKVLCGSCTRAALSHLNMHMAPADLVEMHVLTP